jgi:uncharacterized heparinase superfamily protein
VQIAARPASVLSRALIRSIPAASPPELRSFPAPAPAALGEMAEAERERAGRRLGRLPPGSLQEYEIVYGFELGDGRHPAGPWPSRMAVAPFPASVRARRIAVAVKLGRADLGPELARAARAIALQPELHLLGNHLLENALGLACAGAVASGPEADVWWRLGSRLLSWQIDEQILPDGGHFEQSASYHLAITLGLLEAVHLAEAAGRPVPPAWPLALHRALAFAGTVRAPDGTYPLFNDAAFDAAPSIDALLALSRALGHGPPPATAPPAAWEAHRLPSTGWILARAHDHLLVLDAGPDGARYQPGHVHADALTFELWVDGVRAIADFGVAAYGRGPIRDETRATRSHNTVTVDGQDSAEVWHSFRTGRLAHVTRCEVTRALRGDGGIRIHVAHDGFAWMPGAPVHERIVEVAGRRVVIEDRVPCARRPFQSRLRLTRAGRERLRVEGSRPIATREHVWHPEHGAPEEAVVLEQEAAPGGAIVWHVGF